MNNTATALKTFVESLSDQQIRQFVAHGGFIGIARGTDLSDIQMGNIIFVGDYLANRGSVGELFMDGCYFSSLSQAPELEAGDLKPSAGSKGSDLSARFTASFVKEARGLLALAVIDSADALDDGMARVQSRVAAERLFGEIVDLYEDAAGDRLRGLMKGWGNVAVFQRDGGLTIGFSAGSRALPNNSDSNVAFYVNGAMGHDLFGDPCDEDAFAAWLKRQGIADPELERLIQASREDAGGDAFGELQDGFLEHGKALEALRNDVVAALKKDAEAHKAELTDDLLAWVDAAQREE